MSPTACGNSITQYDRAIGRRESVASPETGFSSHIWCEVGIHQTDMPLISIICGGGRLPVSYTGLICRVTPCHSFCPTDYQLLASSTGLSTPRYVHPPSLWRLLGWLSPCMACLGACLHIGRVRKLCCVAAGLLLSSVESTRFVAGHDLGIRLVTSIAMLGDAPRFRHFAVSVA